MTKKELSQLYWLKKEMAIEKQRLKELRARMYPSAVSMDGNVKSSHDGSQTENLTVEIVELERIIQKRIEECEKERLKLESYISGIDDSLVRMVLTLRYVECLPWLRVWSKIGGPTTVDSLRKMCYRYLEREEKNLSEKSDLP